MSFVESLGTRRGNKLCLIVAPCAAEKLAWYFIDVLPLKYERFKREVFTGAVNLASYGAVVRRGYGESPPEPVVAEMRERYGYTG